LWYKGSSSRITQFQCYFFVFFQFYWNPFIVRPLKSLVKSDDLENKYLSRRTRNGWTGSSSKIICYRLKSSWSNSFGYFFYKAKRRIRFETAQLAKLARKMIWAKLPQSLIFVYLQTYIFGLSIHQTVTICSNAKFD